MDNFDEEVVQSVARRLRDTYYEERQRLLASTRGTGSYISSSPRHVPRWDGGMTERGVYYKPIWPQIARHCLAHSIVPEDLVRTAFLEWKGLDPPYPNHLLSSRVTEAYLKYAKKSEASLRSRVEAEMAWAGHQVVMRTMNREGTAEQIYVAVILDPYHLSPVVRYVLARSLGLNELAGQLLRAASEEYSRQPKQYDAVMPGHIDSHLKDLAARIRPRS